MVFVVKINKYTLIRHLVDRELIDIRICFLHTKNDFKRTEFVNLALLDCYFDSNQKEKSFFVFILCLSGIFIVLLGCKQKSPRSRR